MWFLVIFILIPGILSALAGGAMTAARLGAGAVFTVGAFILQSGILASPLVGIPVILLLAFLTAVIIKSVLVCTGIDQQK